MKLKSLSFITAAAVLMALVPVAPALQAKADTNYTLVWGDDFNGSSLDTSIWNYDTGTGSSGWGNNELEYYTNRTQNVAVQNGNLVITAQRESYGGASYTSGRIKTQGLKQMQYGKIEARIKIPTGQGLWPAFWMLGTNMPSVGWPQCGEIDAMEHINNNSFVAGSTHWYSNGQADYTNNSGNLDMSQFHTYDVTWDTNYIRWYVDGAQFNEFYIGNGTGNTQAFQNPFFVILNLAVGGNWPGSPDGSTQFPAQMLVDYVHVYQATSSPTTINSGTVYNIINRSTGQYMDISYGSAQDGALVIQWPQDGYPDQKYQAVSTGDGYFKLVAQISGMNLDDAGASTTAGTQYQQHPDNGTDWQKFAITNVDGQYFSIVNKGSGMALGVAGSGSGAGVVQNPYSGSAAQQWQFVAVG